ncbi:MAG: TerB family tellurite resistance protein, partial [bacterium]
MHEHYDVCLHRSFGRRGFWIGAAIGCAWSLLSSLAGSARKQKQRMNRSQFLRDLLEEASRRSGNRSEQLESLAGIFMAVVKQNPEGHREIHRRMAHQVLSTYARQARMHPSTIIQTFEEWGDRQINVDQLAESVSAGFPRKAQMNFIHDLALVAFADGEFSEDEQGMIKYIGKQFGLSEDTIEDLFERVRRRMGQARGRSGRTP